MNGGGKAALLISWVVIGGCSSDTSTVQVRAIPNASAALSGAGDAVAVARGQLLLGNAGLALEGFRKAQRENPSNPQALAGIGDCYSAMGRFDLAQTNYEAALALSPRDRKLLLGLAAIYEREGKTARAMIARAEAGASPATTAAAAPPLPQVASAAPKHAEIRPAPTEPPRAAVAMPKPALGSITVELPPARPAPRLQAQAAVPAMPQLAQEPAVRAVPPTIDASTTPQPISRPLAVANLTVELPAAAPAEHLQARVALPPMEQLLETTADVESFAALLATAPEQPVRRRGSALAGVTVALPPARPADRLEARAAPETMPQIEEHFVATSSVTVPLPPARPVPAPAPQRDDRQNAAIALAPGPRLERLSRGEVALVTTGKPLWRTPDVQMASRTEVRWVALASSRDRPNVRILNAARSQGLAASARTVLSDRGWRKIAVGDAPAVLRKSVVLYPKGREGLGRRLAAQFGVSAQMADRDDVVLMLGRDSVRRIGG